MICVIFIQIIISIFRDFLLFSIGQRIDSKLILNYYKHILRLPQTFFDTMRVGEILSRMTDANKIRTFINQTAFGIIINVFTIIIAFGLMLFFSWRLSLIIVAAIPFFMIIFFLYNKLNKTFQRKTMESVADLQSHIVESLNSIQTIKRFGLENFSDTKTEILYVKMMRNIYKNVIGGIFIGCGNSFISSGVTILILWIGSILVIDNNLTPGTLLIFYSLISYVVTPVVALISSNSSIQDAIIAGDRLFQIMNLEQEDSKLSNVELTCDMVGDINFTNVEFRYGAQKNIFTNLNLTIEHAKITAIVGESGSGKTTLASLLQNIYPLNKGKIEIGGFDLTMFTNSSLRRIVSTVPQSVELFMGTLVENIAIGDYSPNIGRVQKLISLLGLKNLVDNLPNGIYSQIGEHGVSLSGGERQKVAIARSLYKKPKILILDEATSSLDSIAENNVYDILQKLVVQGMTIIVITHKLNAIKLADKIIVLKDGHVIESGKHGDLMKNKSEYYNLLKRKAF